MGCWTLFAVLVIFVVILKVVLKLRIRWNRSPECLVGKTAIVTGANTGIGFYTAQDLAKRGARVILACRDKSRAEKAKNAIIDATGNPNVIVKILDLTSFASVRQFAKDINETEENLHILINNAGVGKTNKYPTEDGLDFLFQANYFGPFLLTLLLLDLMKKSPKSRIVNVSSMAHKWATLNSNELGMPAKGQINDARHYANSKLCQILFTDELAKRLQTTGIRVNSLHPGTVDTDIFKDLPAPVKVIFNPIARAFFKSPEEGAQTSLYVAVSKDLDLISGQYFDNCKFGKVSKDAKNVVLARKVWEKTEELMKLTAEEKKLLNSL